MRASARMTAPDPGGAILVRGRRPCTRSSMSCTRCSTRLASGLRTSSSDTHTAAALVRLYQFKYPADVVGIVLVDAAADNPWRKTPDKGLVRSSDLATGKPIPEVKTSDPLRDSEIPERFVTMIKDQVPQLSAHANDPPRNKLPADAQRMRTWSYAQVKMHISNDNPFEAEELGNPARRADPNRACAGRSAADRAVARTSRRLESGRSEGGSGARQRSGGVGRAVAYRQAGRRQAQRPSHSAR